jgi:hypothetical protein
MRAKGPRPEPDIEWPGLAAWQASRRHSPAIPGVRTRVAVAEPRRETASKIVVLRRALDIRLRPWAFRPGTGLLLWAFVALHHRWWRALYELESGRFQGFL